MPSYPRVYDSVLEVWMKSMVAMDNLVSGVAQQIQNPAVLLGLSSWHLYPDISFLGRELTHVQQNDDLVSPGGLVTIGFQNVDSEHEKGITWTMPLAHLRYYGKPVESQRSLGSSSTRTTFRRIVQAALGSAISKWGRYTFNFESVCEFFQALPGSCSSAVSNDNKNLALLDLGVYGLEWTKLLAQEATIYLEAPNEERKEMMRFVNLGQRRFARFLAPEEFHPEPLFGLSDPGTFLHLLDVEGQIKVIRRLVATYDLGIDLRDAVILYFPSQDFDEHTETSIQELPFDGAEFATLFPQSIGQASKPLHRRWILPTRQASRGNTDGTTNGMPRRPKNSAVPLSLLTGYSKIGVSQMFEKDENSSIDSAVIAAFLRANDIMSRTFEPCGILSEEAIIRVPDQDHQKRLQSLWSPFVWSNSAQTFEHVMTMVHRVEEDFSPVEKISQGLKIGASSHEYGKDICYKPLFGSRNCVLYQPVKKFADHSFKMPLAFVTRVLRSGLVSQHRLCDFLKWSKNGLGDLNGYYRSLYVLHKANMVYERLPAATIDLSVLSHSLYKSAWASSDHSRGSQYDAHDIVLKRARAMACVTLFDTGYLDLAPDDFKDVMAISAGDTLYVSEMLLSDPSHFHSDYALRCFTGNVGKPGIALLVSPRDLLLREPELENWDMVNHHDFDGQIQDSFRSTSLHLSLTGYELALNTGAQGRRDQEAFYVEANVSVREEGTWAGDVDILGLYQASDSVTSTVFLSKANPVRQQGWLNGRVLRAGCRHSRRSGENYSRHERLTSIDSWTEYLDPPRNACVIRAKGNWTARLGFAAAMRGREENALIATDKICWACVQETARRLGLDEDRLVILC